MFCNKVLNVLYLLSQKGLRERPNIDSSRSTYVGEETHTNFPRELMFGKEPFRFY